MKRLLQRTLLALLFACLAGAAWLAYQVTHPPAIDAYAALQLPPAPASTGVRVTFLGVGSLLITDGDTAIMTDGFFTRPGRKQVLFGKIAPDPALIRASLARAGVHQLAALIVAHSHYDHVLDAPEVAKQTGALLVGSESTANVARGWGLPEAQLRIVKGGEQFDFGRFHVSLIKSRHTPTGFTGGEIAAPLHPPARANAYLEGGTYAILVQHGGHSLLVNSSTGYVEGALRGLHADTVFLGIATLGQRGSSYQQAYWQQVVRMVGARRVIPIHWDDFTQPLAQPLLPLPYPFDKFDASIALLLEKGSKDGVQIGLAPAWVAIDPFAGL